MTPIKQRDITDCGAACLAAVSGHYGLRQSVAFLRTQLGTTTRGTTALGLVEAARKLGLTAMGVKGTFEQAASAPLPAIAHCLVDGRLLHYVVVIRITSSYVEVMDPAEGRISQWPLGKFRSVWTGVLVLLEPGESFVPGNRTVSPLRRVWQLMRPHRSALVLTFAGAVLSTLLTLATAVYVQKLIDHVIPRGDGRLLNQLGVVMLALLALRLGLGALQSLLSLRTAQRLDATLMMGYYRHLLRLPQAFFDTMRVGEITSRVADAVKVRHFLNTALLSLLLNPFIILFSLGGMFLYSPKLALVSLLLLPASAAIYWVMDRRNRLQERELMERGADFGAQLTESLGAQSVIRRFRLEAHAVQVTETKLDRLLRAVRQSSLVALGGGLATTLITQAYLVGVLWLGGVFVLSGYLTLGQLMSCYTLATCLTGPLTALVGLNTSIQDALIATDRLFEIMDLELEKNPGTAEFAPAADRILRLDHVTFRHAGRRATLTDVTLAFPAGRITALAGETGCGKSTLLALIQRLYLPEQGRVMFGDADAQTFTLDSLRRHLGVVPQSTVLLSGTVRENLAPGDPQPDMDRLRTLCREVGVLELIENLPRGFDTMLTENGANLSGGQRQRLALVRALYLDAPILLLDEPTAALDPASESAIIALLQKLRKEGRTIVIAAHHPAILACADCVVEMTGGKVTAINDQACAGIEVPLKTGT